MNDAIPQTTPNENGAGPFSTPAPLDERPTDDHVFVTNSGKSQANIGEPEHRDYVGEPTVVDVEFTYPTHTDPMRVNSHNVFLDDEMRKAAEIQRAKVEGREPDLENPPAMQGTPLQPTTEVRKNLPGDHVVEAEVSLPVVVGVNEENLSGYGAAVHAREVSAAHADANENKE